MTINKDNTATYQGSIGHVYGNTVEPGGMSLDIDRWTNDCPDCGKEASFCCWETAHGGAINVVSAVSCSHCGYSDSDGDEYY